MVLKVENPRLLPGGGAIIANAYSEFIELAEHLSRSVVTTLMGNGGFPADHPFYVGWVGTSCNTPCGNQIFLESDLVWDLAAISLTDTPVFSMFTADLGNLFVQISNRDQIGRICEPNLGIVYDAKLVLRAMVEVANHN